MSSTVADLRKLISLGAHDYAFNSSSAFVHEAVRQAVANAAELLVLRKSKECFRCDVPVNLPDKTYWQAPEGELLCAGCWEEEQHEVSKL